MTEQPYQPGLDLDIAEAQSVAAVCSQLTTLAGMGHDQRTLEEQYSSIEPLLTSDEHVRMAALTFASTIAFTGPPTRCSCGGHHPIALRFVQPNEHGDLVEVPTDDVAEPERSAGRFITAIVGSDFHVAFALLRAVPAEELRVFTCYLLASAIQASSNFMRGIR